MRQTRTNGLASALAEVAFRLYPHTFAQQCRLTCEGGTPFRINRLMRFLGQTIGDAIYEGGARLIVNVQPRVGKSELVSFAVPTWFLDNWPSMRLILAGHTAELARNFGRRIRNELATNDLLTTRLREDSKAAGRWNTTDGGGLYAVGVGGGITGFGGDVIIADDPHKGWADAQSPVKRKAVAEWFEGTLLSRLEPNGSVIVVMQRWHPDDLTGHLIKKSREPWRVISLPAFARDNDPMGREPGEVVCPERYDRVAMEAIRTGRPKAVWDANYDQNPQASYDGRVYSPFRLDRHVKQVETELRLDLPLQLAWDFNTNPGVHVEIGQYNRDLFTTRHEIFADRANTPTTLKLLKKKLDEIDAFKGGRFRFPHCEIYGDASGQNQNSTVTSDSDYDLILRAMREWGVPARLKVPRSNPAVKDRMLAVNDALLDSNDTVHYLIHPDCRRLIHDYENVMEDEDGLIDKSDQNLTHPSDAEGYRIYWQRPVRTLSDPGEARVGFVGG